jgi:hypothetical protein
MPKDNVERELKNTDKDTANYKGFVWRLRTHGIAFSWNGYDNNNEL